MAKIEKAKYKLGDIVVLKSFPESLEKIKGQEAIFLEEPPSLVPPFMVISEIFCNEISPKEHNESTGFKKEKSYFYQCNWFDANSGNVRTKRIYEPLLESVAETEKIDTNNLKAGTKVILATNKVERLKKYANGNIYVKQRDIANFIPPIMLVTDFEAEENPEEKNKNKHSKTSEYRVKCMWYNSAKSKYEREFFASDILELIK